MYLISLAYVTFFSLSQLKCSIFKLSVAFYVVVALLWLEGAIAWQIPVIILLLSVFNYLISKNSYFQHKYATILTDSVVFFTAAALFLHLIPGFNNVLVIDNLIIGATSSIPYSMYINYDKALAGLLVLLYVAKNKQVIGNVSLHSLIFTLLAAFSIVALACFSLNLVFDPKWLGNVSILFVLVKSFSTAFAEEIIFRGMIQAKLAQWFSPTAGWILASLFFGAVHAGAGTDYMLTAFGAGVVYGYIFKKYQSILLASLCHCVVNIIHFSLLTYPM